ncbi:bifunctional DNA-formamidopyrimidine glycosylase/DNA-(apurinic or apyrimidinic site) lyase [Pseudokineococcus marinus]|uniref:Formamidopyrimidine-DNA glycosylase n=1 Tax=Pseudokineococcus marinus TaxID=351215 RepID=A0A849BKG6_9ACTN|nr:bifunctional DNA-formamidopyrimidine glycosylase/DNA-(apurinic or apyrimidinic site) lyase [Pseudokineococcus marinus]NNH23101.1 bifunctional DNA-formamidopyrimidine glycosylase/DNA-(apurinic or apyrimidinic site) lyase [Pseudokineococcus marinus]
MPELPEVEVVRRGLDAHVVGRTITDVAVLHPRPVRRHLAGPLDFAGRLAGARVDAAVRRGKYLWLQLDTGDALSAHLGMSGQMLVQRPGAPDERHLRVRLDLDDGAQLRFVDQRMFGGLLVAPLVPTPDGLPAGAAAGGPSDPLLPPEVAHVARDPLDPHLDLERLVERLRARRTGVKRALLDQTLVSGVGNIYADEALWRSRLHFARPTDGLTRPVVRRLLADVAAVMEEALAQGGTSFDRLYVNVNGASGYFDRSLAAYGQEGEPCPRCGAPVTREAFMNRSSYRCPRCQPVPRRARW